MVNDNKMISNIIAFIIIVNLIIMYEQHITFGFFGMLYGLNSLIHHTIISCNHQDDYISDHSSTCPHGRKRCMTRCVQKSDLLT